MRARLRGPAGASTISLPDDATIADLVARITSNTSLTNFDVKYGYPPRPLLLEKYEKSQALDTLDVKLDGEQLTISPREGGQAGGGAAGGRTREQTSGAVAKAPASAPTVKAAKGGTREEFSFANVSGLSQPQQAQPAAAEGLHKPVSLHRKGMEGDVPELPLPERGATLVLRVMPDDNSCLFRAFGTAVLPGDDQTMPELRSLVASEIHSQPELYTKVVLEQNPDDYCRWIQTPDAWGGAIEMGILAKHFDLEICSIDVQSLRVDTFNSGRPTRCILVYSGIHYDTIVQSPSDPPHTKADAPPEFDKRVWDSDDEEILAKAKQLCRKLNEQHYFTDTGGMAIKCNECGAVVYGEGQASGHAQQMGHYDMAEVVG